MIVRLAHEPFCMSADEIGRLDPWWILNVIYFPRDEKGKFLPMPDAEPKDDHRITEKEAFWIRWRAKGFADWRIAEFWKERHGR